MRTSDSRFEICSDRNFFWTATDRIVATHCFFDCTQSNDGLLPQLCSLLCNYPDIHRKTQFRLSSDLSPYKSWLRHLFKISVLEMAMARSHLEHFIPLVIHTLPLGNFLHIWIDLVAFGTFLLSNVIWKDHFTLQHKLMLHVVPIYRVWQ